VGARHWSDEILFAQDVVWLSMIKGTMGLPVELHNFGEFLEENSILT